jgi:REP element-mobilizing transposase RayT
MNIPASPLNRHTRDLRKGRFSEPGRAYLLTAVVHNRSPIFADWMVGRLLVAELRSAEEDGLAQSQALVVMPDHLHWLVTLQTGTITRLMQRIKDAAQSPSIAYSATMGTLAKGFQGPRHP